MLASYHFPISAKYSTAPVENVSVIYPRYFSLYRGSGPTDTAISRAAKNLGHEDKTAFKHNFTTYKLQPP